MIDLMTAIKKTNYPNSDTTFLLNLCKKNEVIASGSSKSLLEIIDDNRSQIQWLTSALLSAVSALQKIEDPRLRDHKEPDAYTELGCVMNMASIALDEIAEFVPALDLEAK